MTTDYPSEPRFTGTVRWAELEVGLDSHDHLISPEDRLNHAMARQ